MPNDFPIYFHDPKNKPVVFALSAALGCLIAALLAEGFLLAPPKGEPAQSICLTIDTSGSMAGNLMREMQKAAQDFVDQRAGDNLALTIFSSDARVVEPFTTDHRRLKATIGNLLAFGATNFEAALRESIKVLETSKNSHKTLLIFTDGENTEGDADQAIRAAKSLREQGVRIFAVAALDADVMYLAALTGDRNSVVDARSGGLDKAFGEVEKMM